jgi:hypothetical protein
MNSFTCAVYSTLAAEKNPSLRKQRKRGAWRAVRV